ncbi:MAG: hypothetical protein L0I84_00610 [Halomonas subglaciescola]|nr:hypothetical protein [Halomonas subglaciescola]
MFDPTPRWPISVRALILRAVLYLLVIGAIAQGAYLEAAYLPSVRFSERGFTELAQTAFLAAACALLLYARCVYKVWPHVIMLMFAFVAASLVREQDSFLDAYAAKNVWKILVALIVIPIIAWVVFHRRRFAAELAEYGNTFSLGLFTGGVLTTYVFSRLYGRTILWQAIMEDDYLRSVKDMAEEIVELMGYSLILFATIELLLLTRRIYRAQQQHVSGRTSMSE